MTSGAIKSLSSLYRARPMLCVAVVLLVWTCLVRLPFLHVIQEDEAFYSVVASRWLRGELPYVASFDVKAPGVFFLFALLQPVLGASLLVIKGVEIVFTALGAFGLYRLLTKHASSRAGLWAAGLYPIYSLIVMGVSSPCQIIQAGLTIWAFAWAFDALASGKWSEAALSGLMIGLAVTVKQTAAFEAVALMGLLAWRLKAWRPVLAFAVAAALPGAGFVVYFAAAGHLPEAFTSVVTLAGLRSQTNITARDSAWYLDLLARLGHYPPLIKPFVIATCGAALALMRRKRLNAAFALPVVDLTLVWYAAAAVGMLIVRLPEDWYAEPLIAPSLILFACVLCHGIAFAPRWRTAWIAAYTLLAAVQPLAGAATKLFGSDYRGPPDWRANVVAAQALKAAGLRAQDNLLVLSRGQFVYILTGALPATRYFHSMHLLCPFPALDADPLAAAFATRPKFVVMADETFSMGCTDQTRLPRIRAELAKNYIQTAAVSGRWDRFTIYRAR